MSDIVKRLQSTLRMGIIERGSSPEEYAVASSQIKEAISVIVALRQEITPLEEAAIHWRNKFIELKYEKV